MGVLRSVCMGLDGCGRSPGIDLDGVGWYGMSWMSIEGLEWVRTTWDSPYPPKALHTYLRPFTLISGPPHELKDLHTHFRLYIPILDQHTFPWRCTPTLDPPDQSQDLLTYHRPYVPIPDVPYQP